MCVCVCVVFWELVACAREISVVISSSVFSFPPCAPPDHVKAMSNEILSTLRDIIRVNPLFQQVRRRINILFFAAVIIVLLAVSGVSR